MHSRPRDVLANPKVGHVEELHLPPFVVAWAFLDQFPSLPRAQREEPQFPDQREKVDRPIETLEGTSRARMLGARGKLSL